MYKYLILLSYFIISVCNSAEIALFETPIDLKDEAAGEIYDLVRECYPKPFKLPIKIEFKGGYGKNITSALEANAVTDIDRYYAGIVVSIPLWNETEKDRARNDERSAHVMILEAIQKFLLDHQNLQLKVNQHVLLRMLEKRSQDRVAEGIVSTTEQIDIIRELIVVSSEVNVLKHSVEISKLSLQQMCERSPDNLTAYLENFLKGEK